MKVVSRLLPATLLLCTLTTPVFPGCPGPAAIYHVPKPGHGAFDLTATQYAEKGSPGPDVRFWGYNNFAAANSGTQNQQLDRFRWLNHLNVDYFKTDLPKGYWYFIQSNWYGVNIVGCAPKMEDTRTVFELSFSDDRYEGSKEHRGYYLACSVPFVQSRAGYCLDLVKGAGGKLGNVVSAAPIPPVVPTSTRGNRNGKDPEYMDVTLKLAPLASYSEEGRDKPVALLDGFRIYYASGDEPTSSKPDGYTEVRDPEDPAKPLGLVPSGAESVTVAVPSPKNGAWFVSRIQYKDATTELLSNATSGHSNKVAAPKGRAVKRR